ncbi:hypothetical protein C8F04DRAFT_1321374 [Mycena alexandri]|uniref:Uncharacterized protein n=1 Tax=Mycena alexandri TaxID=1745969 RepID=A0AAD6WNS6_9AGAR|nr:hypothetical protein C8F04DRAFT_1321374 [Mycena alexandri]
MTADSQDSILSGVVVADENGKSKEKGKSWGKPNSKKGFRTDGDSELNPVLGISAHHVPHVRSSNRVGSGCVSGIAVIELHNLYKRGELNPDLQRRELKINKLESRAVFERGESNPELCARRERKKKEVPAVSESAHDYGSRTRSFRVYMGFYVRRPAVYRTPHPSASAIAALARWLVASGKFEWRGAMRIEWDSERGVGPRSALRNSEPERPLICQKKAEAMRTRPPQIQICRAAVFDHPEFAEPEKREKLFSDSRNATWCWGRRLAGGDVDEHAGQQQQS